MSLNTPTFITHTNSRRGKSGGFVCAVAAGSESIDWYIWTIRISPFPRAIDCR
ncbi:hypothetical protein SAMN02927900_00593 [Rhizobium mongolense subsp. loessense]|uniref:Uncharacterized protein n=1 Tax=Rhizobium mongolense subsp. loessense TaxID=158890 RepID=A0A1G4PJ70_9HYPH|nr:hypothetical protein SAMN02927900_00593 [Rhizobium mongolense subsp. loessense]